MGRFRVLHACLVSGLLLMLAPALAGCHQARFTGDDAEMMRCAKLIAGAIDTYFRENGEYPDKLRQVEPFLPPGVSWPANPYTGQPIEDTGSLTFDPTASVGQVAYERIWRDEQQVTYQLHVYGDRGRLYVIGNTAVRLKE